MGPAVGEGKGRPRGLGGQETTRAVGIGIASAQHPGGFGTLRAELGRGAGHAAPGGSKPRSRIPKTLAGCLTEREGAVGARDSGVGAGKVPVFGHLSGSIDPCASSAFEDPTRTGVCEGAHESGVGRVEESTKACLSGRADDGSTDSPCVFGREAVSSCPGDPVVVFGLGVFAGVQ